MFVAIFYLKNFSNLINYNIFISVIIFFSLFLKLKLKSFSFKNNIYHKLIIFLIGIVHGLSNLGGTLLTIFFVKNDKKLFLNSLYNIHFFYLLLAVSQLLIVLYFVNVEKIVTLNFFNVIAIILITTFIGIRYFIQFNKYCVTLTYLLSAITAFSLIIK